jgi:hypothetical protein
MKLALQSQTLFPPNARHQSLRFQHLEKSVFLAYPVRHHHQLATLHILRSPRQHHQSRKGMRQEGLQLCSQKSVVKIGPVIQTPAQLEPYDALFFFFKWDAFGLPFWLWINNAHELACCEQIESVHFVSCNLQCAK